MSDTKTKLAIRHGAVPISLQAGEDVKKHPSRPQEAGSGKP
jgi:hypothetical protein